MKNFTFFAFLFAMGLCTAEISAQQPTAYIAESPRGQNSVFNDTESTVIVSAEAPTKTEYDWETYMQYDLPYISFVTIERHTPGTSWPTEEYGRLTDIKPGEKFEFVDRNVEPDKKYEYKLTCYVDDTRGSSSFTSVYTGVKPGAIAAFTATTPDHTSNYVDISVTAPTKSASGADLKGTMSIDIQLYEAWTYTTIHTIENAEPGKSYEFKHKDLAIDKTYTYRAVARIGAEGVGEGLDTEVFVGLDYPGEPTDFKAQPAGESVSLSWKAPLKGGRGGCYDPASTTYTITRVFLDGTEEIAKEGISETEYVDTPGFEEEKALKYRVDAVNASGKNMKEVVLDAIVVGKPATLPFKESFTGQKLEHLGWTKETSQDDPYYTYEAWEFCETGTMYYFPTDEYLQIEPQDFDGGLASCIFYGDSKDGQTESLITPHIAVADIETLDVKFHFWEVQKDASENTIKVSVSRDDKEWEQIYLSQPPVECVPIWKEVVLQIPLNKKAQNVRVRFDAIRHDGPITNVYFDNITVEAKNSSVSDIEIEDAAEPEYFTIQGIRVENPTEPGLYIVRRGNTATKEIIR